jgi:hypothetical protein
MRIFFRQPLIDIAGICVSALCAIHCTVLPLVLTISAFNGFLFLDDPKLESMVLVASAIIGTLSLLASYLRYHRKFSAIGILLLGFVLIALGRVTGNPLTESIVTPLGAITIAIAHFSNIKLCRSS